MQKKKLRTSRDETNLGDIKWWITWRVTTTDYFGLKSKGPVYVIKRLKWSVNQVWPPYYTSFCNKIGTKNYLKEGEKENIGRINKKNEIRHSQYKHKLWIRKVQFWYYCKI